MARERGASRSGKKVDEYNLQEACDWVAGVTGIAQEGHLEEWLHDGVWPTPSARACRSRPRT